MALPPEPPPAAPPHAPYYGGGYNPGANSAATTSRFLGTTPQYTFPDYNALLNQYMAPFRALYEAQIAAMQENITRQQEYAKKQEALGLSDLTQRHDINDRDITNTLVARGLGESGEPTYRHGIEDKNYSNAKGSMQNTLAETLAGLASQLDQAKFSGLMGLQQQQLGLLPFLQNTYQPTLSYPFSRNGTAPPVAPPSPALPLGLGN